MPWGVRLPLPVPGGNTLAQYTYDPFGNTTVTGSSANPYQYTGRENDGTGLDYYRGRYYNPSLGRFISEDPIGFGGGINLYAYVGNSPLSFRDPFGYSMVAGPPSSAGWGFVGGGGGSSAATTGGMAPGSGGSGQYCYTVSCYATNIAIGAIKGLLFAALAEGAGAVLDVALSAAEGTTAEQLAAAASRAAQSVGEGSGPVYGTNVHTAFQAEVDALGNPSLFTEQSYLNGEPVDYGTPGSIRVDVGEGTVDQPTAVYDLKTGSATLSPGRIFQIQSNLPGGSNIPVIVVKP